ncbi:MAG: hypothetical protein HY927_17310 [Elusimicrobia bacterium]|nr:hypothetical protein [Elusimicrobiota bacterium]
MRSPWKRAAWALGLLAVVVWGLWSRPRPSTAIRPQQTSAQDRKRFGLARAVRAVRRRPSARAQRAFGAFDRNQGGGWKVRFSPRTGAPEALTEGRAGPRAGGPRSAAASFLRETRDITLVDPAVLTLSRQNSGSGLSHLLYKQSYRGLPVEFAHVKVHLDDAGGVIGFNSSFEPDLGIGTDPSLAASQAFEFVRAETGPGPEPRGELVIFPDEMTGANRLAWKFAFMRKGSLWRYYIDAHTGQVLFRYDALRRQCQTTGSVVASIADVDPSSTPYAYKPLRHQRVYVQDATHPSDTNASGVYCNSAQGKVFTGLQGPYVNVSNFRGPSAHYDNAGGVWATVATPLSSPHPYPDYRVAIDTVNIAALAPAAVKVLPVFSQFNVGGWAVSDGAGDISDDDQVAVLDPGGNIVASYVGNRAPFNATAVPGPQYSIRLKSNASGNQHGYDILVSSYLTLPNSSVPGASPNIVWSSAVHTNIRLGGEFSAFYQANIMHDFFVGGVDKSSAAFLGVPLNINCYVGPDYVGANYNPDHDILSLGDIDSTAPNAAMMDDGTVTRHEYTHYVQERVFSSPYFGQAGAIQEGLSDYFAGTSMGPSGYSSIGTYVNNALHDPNPMRELNCPPGDPPPQGCFVLSNVNWSGEVHDDSIFFSQSLWDLRKKVIEVGKTAPCVDGLVFEALRFFPESFAEYYDAMLAVDRIGAVASCGPANSIGPYITWAFNRHGLPYPLGDGYERNDGFLTAVDISTISPISATIYPSADVDNFSFSAGPGKIRVVLTLPYEAPWYKAYALTLYDHEHKEPPIAVAQPIFDGANTVEGLYCESFDCNTSQQEVVLEYTATKANVYLLQVHGAESFGFSNSGVYSMQPYTLAVDYSKAAALSASVVSAAVDNDLISFDVHVASFVHQQPWFFAYAQLRGHGMTVLPNTLALPGSAASTYLNFVSSESGHGMISGSARIAPGFAKRFPAVGTVYLEVFAYTPYNVRGSTVSLGLSPPMNLASDLTKLTTYNSVFNPAKGDKVSIKYEVPRPGRMTLKLYTLNGTLVATLFDGVMTGGKGSLDWSGVNLNGIPVASGVYLLHMQSLGINKTQKIVVVK